MPKNERKRAGAKVVVAMLSILLFLFLFASAASAAMMGDVNDSGTVNVQDVVLVQKYVLGLGTLTDAQKAVADVNGDGNVNVQDVTLIMQFALGLIDEFPHAKLAVSKVTAVNPKQVEVEFNRVLKPDEKAKMTTANFHVGLQASPLVDRLPGAANDGSAVAVKDDNRTVLLTMATTPTSYYFVSGSTSNRVVVKKEVGMDADHVVANLAFTDTSVPTLVSVHTESPTTLVLTFSEPLNRTISPSHITLATSEGTNIPLNLFSDYVYVDARRELRIETFGVSLSAGSHTLTIASGTSLRDYAGSPVVPTSKTFTHSPITTAPTVSFKSATENSVTIEFSRAVDSTTLIDNINALFRHTSELSTFYQVNGTDVSNPSKDNRTFTVNFGAKFLPVGNTTLWMKYVDGTADANKVKDTWGNIIQPFSVPVTVVSDTTAPTATVSSVSGSNTEIDVQYSKPVKNAEIIGNYTLKQGTNTITITGISSEGGNRYRLSTAPYEMQGNYNLTISGIRDTSVAENLMPTQTFAVNIPDTIAPFITEPDHVTTSTHFYRQSAQNKVRIFFSEPMNTSDLADKTKYRNVNFANANPTVATPGANGMSVYLEFANNVTGHLQVGSLRDLAGNPIVGFAATLTGVDAPNVTLDATLIPDEPVIATTTRTVRVYLNDIVAGARVDDFRVFSDGSWVEPTGISTTTINGKSVITLTLALDDALTYNALGAEVRTVDSAGVKNPTTYAKNQFGIAVEIDDATVVDRIAPALKSAVRVNENQIRLTFEENLDPTTLAPALTNGFVVSGSTITSQIGGTPNVILINRVSGNNFVAGSTTVSYNATVGGVTDANKNALASFSPVIITTAP